MTRKTPLSAPAARSRLVVCALALCGLLIAAAWSTRGPGQLLLVGRAGPPTTAPATIVLDGGRLLQNSQKLAAGDPTLRAELARLSASANADLTAGPWSVMDKTQVPPSGDKHDYMSQAPYWWPNPKTKTGCPYVQRDGVRNPAADKISDHAEIGAAWQAIFDLSLAWFYTGNAAYATRAELVVRTWFLNPATRMNPNVNFAQGIFPCQITGHSAGIIETSENIGKVIDGLAVLDSGAPGWTSADHAGMQAWLTQFLGWLTTSQFGQQEAQAANNHGSWYDLQAADIDAYTGQTAAATGIVMAAETKRIAVQIKADGSQPLELARTRSWHYSNFNVQALCGLTETGLHLSVNLWSYRSPGGGSLLKAIDFLIPGAEHGRKAWKHGELGTFDQTLAVPALHAAADQGDKAAAAAIPHVPVPAGGDRWQLVPACT
jgi:hypothetical protein